LSVGTILSNPEAWLWNVRKQNLACVVNPLWGNWYREQGVGISMGFGVLYIGLVKRRISSVSSAEVPVLYYSIEIREREGTDGQKLTLMVAPQFSALRGLEAGDW